MQPMTRRVTRRRITKAQSFESTARLTAEQPKPEKLRRDCRNDPRAGGAESRRPDSQHGRRAAPLRDRNQGHGRGQPHDPWRDARGCTLRG